MTHTRESVTNHHHDRCLMPTVLSESYSCFRNASYLRLNQHETEIICSRRVVRKPHQIATNTTTHPRMYTHTGSTLLRLEPHWQRLHEGTPTLLLKRWIRTNTHIKLFDSAELQSTNICTWDWRFLNLFLQGSGQMHEPWSANKFPKVKWT